MDSQETRNSAAESTSDRGGNVVKPNPSLPQGFQVRPQGPPGSPRYPIHNGPVGPRPGGQQPPPQIRRVDSRLSLGPPSAGQFAQIRSYGPPRPPGNSFPQRPPPPGQNSPPIILNPRFPPPPGLRAGPPQGPPRPPYPGNFQGQQFQRNAQFQRPPQPGFEQSQEASLQYPRNSENLPRPPETAQRQLQRNESLLNLPKQSLPSSREDKKQPPARPLIVIDKMADVDQANKTQVTESPVQKKKTELRENGENDDDDDVVMNDKKSPRANGDSSDRGGSVDPKSPKAKEGVQSGSRPGTAVINGKLDAKLADQTTAEKVNEKFTESLKSPEKLNMGVEESDKSNSATIDDKPSSGKLDEEPEKASSNKTTPSKVGKVENPSDQTTEIIKEEKSSTSDLVDENKSKTSAVSEHLDVSRSNTPTAAQSTLKTPTKTPEKSRSSTPTENERHEETENQSKSPDKSRSGTPAVDQTANDELKTPSKSPDIRSSTPAETDDIEAVTSNPEKPSENPHRDKSAKHALEAVNAIASNLALSSSDGSDSKSAKDSLETSNAIVSDLGSPNSDRPGSKSPKDSLEVGNAVASNLGSASSDRSGNISPKHSLEVGNAVASRLGSASSDRSGSKSPKDLLEAGDAIASNLGSASSDRSGNKSPKDLLETGNASASNSASSNSDRSRSKSPKDLLEADNAIATNLASPNSDRPGSKSPKSPDSLGRLPVAGSTLSTPKSPHGSVKGFDNGERRSLSSRSSPCRSPQSPTSPKSLKSPIGSARTVEVEKKKTTFAEDSILEKKDGDKKSADSKGSARTRPKFQRAPTPAKLDDQTEKKLSVKQDIENGSATNGLAQNVVPTTNGVSDSPTKKSPSKTRESDKRSTAGSPVKSPSKSIKSLPRTPETPTSTAALEKKKLPMNKVQVGAAPSPNLKTVRSKIGSLDNASYKPGGGKIKIENRKLDFSKAQPKIAAKNDKYTPSGGDKKIAQVKLQWNAKPKVGSLDNATYKPGGGDKKIETVKLDFKDKAKPKVGSKDNAKHVPGGGSVKSSATPPKTPQDTSNDIQTQKIDIKAESKIGSMDNMKHKPGGGDKKIFNDRDYLRQTGSNVESLSGSGSQVQSPEENNSPVSIEQTKDDSPQPPPSTPTKARNVTSPTSTVTPKAVRSSLAKSPDAAGPKRNLASVSETTENENRRTSIADDSKTIPKEKLRSPSSPRPPSSLRLKSPDKSYPGTPRKASPKELRLPKLAPSPVHQETTPIPETQTKITLPKLIHPSTQSTRVAQ